MNKIDELLNKINKYEIKLYCLKDITISLKRGTLKKEQLIENGKYPVVNGGTSYYGYYDFYNNDGNSIIISSRGAAGFVSYINEKFWAGGLCYAYRSKSENLVLTKYLFYYLKNKQNEIINKLVTTGSIPALNKEDIDNYKIIIPPIEIQNKIVRTLDSFTELTEELTEELTARKKQYEFYREKLLTFNNSVKTVSLGELFDFRNGLSKGKEYFGKGIGFITYSNVYNNVNIKKEYIKSFVECTPQEIKNLGVHRGDIFITRTSETREDVGHVSVLLEDLGDCVFNGFTIKGTPKTNLLIPEYCAYCFFTNDFRRFVTENCSFTTRASLTGKTLCMYKLPLPSLEEQQRIVNILDKFNAYCNDLTKGLPAEIEARQKQYEYYRDKLLTFKVKEN